MAKYHASFVVRADPPVTHEPENKLEADIEHEVQVRVRDRLSRFGLPVDAHFPPKQARISSTNEQPRAVVIEIDEDDFGVFTQRVNAALKLAG